MKARVYSEKSGSKLEVDCQESYLFHNNDLEKVFKSLSFFPPSSVVHM